MALKVGARRRGSASSSAKRVVTNHDQRIAPLDRGLGPDRARKRHHDGQAGGYAGQARLPGGPADVHGARTAPRSHDIYFALVRDIVTAAPSITPVMSTTSII